MSEQNSTQDKTEEASEQKLRKSREQGQVARSKDVATTVSLLATLLALKFAVGLFMDGIEQSFRLSLASEQRGPLGERDLALLLQHNLMLFVWVLLPLLVTPLLVVAFGLVPGGWVFAAKNFSPTSASSTRWPASSAWSVRRTGPNWPSRC